MRMISWNMNKARGDSPSWKYLVDRAPDLAFGQEVGCGEFSRARK